jgi:hypothetical protein
MKRTWIVFVTLIMAIVLIGVLVLALARSPGRHTVTWRSIVTSYIEYQGWGKQVTIAQAVKARAPYNFTKELNLFTYGEAPYYMVNETSSSYNGSRPIPYPPKEVWCVLLQQQTSGNDTFSLIFANLHEDMYMAEWIVHQCECSESEPPPLSQAFLDDIASLGCDLDLTNLPVE